MSFGRLRLSQNKFIESNQTATNDKDSCLLVVNAQEWNEHLRGADSEYTVVIAVGLLKERRWNHYHNS